VKLHVYEPCYKLPEVPSLVEVLLVFFGQLHSYQSAVLLITGNTKYATTRIVFWLLLKSDTAIQRYSDTGTGTWNRNLEPGTVHKLCKLEHFAPQEIYMIIIYGGGGDAIQR
jgi:hypothetical protein